MKITNPLVLRAFGFQPILGGQAFVDQSLRLWGLCAWWRIKAMFGGAE